MTKSRKRILYIFLTIVLFFVVIGLSFNLILSTILSNALNYELDKVNESGQYKISVETAKVNVFSKTLIFKNIEVHPDSSAFELAKQGKSEKGSLMRVFVGDLRFRGISIRKALINNEIDLSKVIIKEIVFDKYNFNQTNKKSIDIEDKSDGIRLDSIYIKGMMKVHLGKFVFDEYSFNIIDEKSGDTINSYGGSELTINGIALKSLDNAPGYFKIDNRELRLKLKRQRFDLKNGDYFAYFEKLDYLVYDSILIIDNLKFKPVKDRKKLASSYKYTKEVFDVEVKKLEVFGFRIHKLIEQGMVDIDSVMLSNFQIEIYKDKTKPWNYDKRPLFPQQSLKRLEKPIHIGRLILNDSRLTYIERPEKTTTLMKAEISKINGQVNFITSIRDSLMSGKDLTIDMQALLMEGSSLDLNIIMPYDSPVDTFYLAGILGRGRFTKFNPAVFPATGIKFKKGILDGMDFYAYGSPKGTRGQMTLLFHDLEAMVTKKDDVTDNKTLSFFANAVLPVSNPNKKGKIKVAVIDFERVEYKGFGNLLWKSVQSGLMNTLLPIGKQVKDKDAKANKNKYIEEKKKSRRKKNR